MLLALIFGTIAHAQKPVYLCEGVYPDKPSKNGREVDIAPTRGAHSMSGSKRERSEAVIDRVNRDMEKARASRKPTGPKTRPSSSAIAPI